MAINLILKPKKQFKLKRLGGLNDGGYLVGVHSIANTQTLISFGIDNNWKFEVDFKILNPNCEVNCYDDKNLLNYLLKKLIKEIIFLPYYRKFHFIQSFKNIINFFAIKKKINFFQKKIFYNDLNKIFANLNLTKNTFLKVDIEGSEYRILDEILKHQEKIIGIVIEFHDFDYHKNTIYEFCKKLNLELIHIHPNNNAPLDNCDNPTVIELTFERNPIVLGDKVILPNNLDMKNNSMKEDIELIFK